jgi:NAD(P)H-hydrate epimerase
MSTPPASHPVLSSDETRRLEKRLFGGDEAKEWTAMRHAGRAVAEGVIEDFREVGGFPPRGRVLVLAGKGHNGGDALLAAQTILGKFPEAAADVVFALGERALRPLAFRAYRELAHAAGRRLTVRAVTDLAAKYDLCLDGVFGFQFRPPVDAVVAGLLARVNARPIRLRAAVDLPSGLGEGAKAGSPDMFRADFTYATGVVKTPVVDSSYAEVVGRLRYLDLGFFDETPVEARLRMLTPEVLAPLARLRAPNSDKRDYGHLFILGGSRGFPGAIQMTVQAALRSGAGLLTAFVPESLVPAFAAQAPEAMWVGWPETPEGGLALEGRHLLQARLTRGSALVMGPGMGKEPETLALAKDVVQSASIPLVLDADALQPDIVRAGKAPRVLTPHRGEFMRILAGGDFREFQKKSDAVVVLKGRLTGITHQERGYYSPYGSPVLARGGSGDCLAGIVGTQLAQTPGDPLGAACRGTVWHGRAADLLARTHGQVAVRTTQLLDFLSPALHTK